MQVVVSEVPEDWRHSQEPQHRGSDGDPGVAGDDDPDPLVAAVEPRQLLRSQRCRRAGHRVAPEIRERARLGSRALPAAQDEAMQRQRRPGKNGVGTGEGAEEVVLDSRRRWLATGLLCGARRASPPRSARR